MGTLSKFIFIIMPRQQAEMGTVLGGSGTYDWFIGHRPCSQRLLVSEFQYMAVGLWAMDLTFPCLGVLIWKLETVRGLTKRAD